MSIGEFLVRRHRLMRMALVAYGRSKGCKVEFHETWVGVTNRNRCVELRLEHVPYVRDVVDQFDHYFNSISDHEYQSGISFADFRAQSDHQLVGWDLFPFVLPGLPEPMETIEQYISLTDMHSGQTIIDLGAYSGLSSLAFMEVVGEAGRVAALEADPINAECARINFGRYQTKRGFGPSLVEAAIWSSDGNVEFTSEGSLGSAVTEVLPRAPGSNRSVQAVTLSTFKRMNDLESIDIIKADIEGAEHAAFSDRTFFEDQHPVLVFEPANSRVPETQLRTISGLLQTYGYSITTVAQAGSRLPLVVCR